MSAQSPTAQLSSSPVSKAGFWQNYRHSVFLIVAGFFIGALWFTAMRFFLVSPSETHYHANFAVFIDGEREEFSDQTYYEEIAACSEEYETNPRGRAHMHEMVNDVIHIHDERVTYGHFFQNIGWAVGEDFVAARGDVYVTEKDKEVSFVLNGENVDRIENRVIGNMDRLLVSYGDNATDIDAQFLEVADTAEEVNKYDDPASCGGLNGTGHSSFTERLKRATFWE